MDRCSCPANAVQCSRHERAFARAWRLELQAFVGRRVLSAGPQHSAAVKFLALHFRTVEVNNGFYRLLSEMRFQGRRIQVPPEFICEVRLMAATLNERARDFEPEGMT